jgi:hypothetical protein
MSIFSPRIVAGISIFLLVLGIFSYQVTCTAVDAPGTTNDDFKITNISPFEIKYTNDNINTCSIPITIVFLPIGILLFIFSMGWGLVQYSFKSYNV